MKLRYIDFERPLPDIPPATCGEQWALLRVHGAPFGCLRLPADGCTAREVASLALAHHGSALGRHLIGDYLPDLGSAADLAAIPGACPRRTAQPRAMVTVAVCTRNGASRLTACLDALAALDYPSALLDRVVVDNAPIDDSTRSLVRRYPPFRYVPEARPGLDRARNCAIRAAKGEIVAFTDDDVSVDSGWVKAIAGAFDEEPDAMCLTGLVVPDEVDTLAQKLFEEYGGFGRGFSREVFRVDAAGKESAAGRYGGTGRFGTGANMAFRRVFFDLAGSFDPALDVGTPTQGGGDLEMFFRVLKSGHALVYEPAAIVRHRHRRTRPELKAQLTANGIGFYSYLMRTWAAYPDERAAIVRLGVWWLWWWNVRRLLRALLGVEKFPADLILAELAGSLRGPRRYRISRRLGAAVPETR